MLKSKNRMIKNHPRSRKTHDISDKYFHIVTVTMQGTFTAGRFFLAKATKIKPCLCIMIEFFTFPAKLLFVAMFLLAIKLNHNGHGLFFGLYFGACIFFI